MSADTPPATRDPYAKLKGEGKTGKVFKKFDIKPSIDRVPGAPLILRHSCPIACRC